jgi:hypothetical protein
MHTAKKSREAQYEAFREPDKQFTQKMPNKGASQDTFSDHNITSQALFTEKNHRSSGFL